MHCELLGAHKESPLRSKSISRMGSPQLRIVNYELIQTRTSVRLFYVAFQIFFEFFFVNGVFPPKKASDIDIILEWM